MLHAISPIIANHSTATIKVVLPYNLGRENRTGTPVAGKLRKLWTTFDVDEETSLERTTMSFFYANRFHPFEIHHTTPQVLADALDKKFQTRNRMITVAFSMYKEVPELGYDAKRNVFFIRIPSNYGVFSLNENMWQCMGFQGYISPLRAIQARKNSKAKEIKRVHGYVQIHIFCLLIKIDLLFHVYSLLVADGSITSLTM